MNWSLYIYQTGEAIGLIFAGYLLALGYIIASCAMLVASFYLANLIAQEIVREVRKEYD